MQPLLTDYLVVWASSELLQSWGQEFFLNEIFGTLHQLH